MLRLLSIRDFVVVSALELELEPGFTVLTGETGAGKSILLDALGLLLGDRFEPRQIRAGAERAELAAAFDVDDAPSVRAWLVEEGLAESDGEVLLRRVLDAQGRSRAWINGSPATLAQLKALGERLVEITGQHAHQALSTAETQRELVDSFGGFAALAQETGSAFRHWKSALQALDAARVDAGRTTAERDFLEARARELSSLAMREGEWAELSAAQSRLANAASLIEACAGAAEALEEADDALTRRVSQLVSRLSAAATHDPALAEVVALLEPARVQLDEAARALRDYRRRLDLDPAELSRIDERLAALHDTARKHRVRPEALPDLLASTQAALDQLAAASDVDALERRARDTEEGYLGLARQLRAKRRFAASELEHRVTAAMHTLAMAGGRLEIALEPLAAPAAHGLDALEFRIAAHAKQPVGPLSRVASGGELSRVGLAIQVAASDVAQVPTLVFDEVDAGIGGAVAATVGRLLQSLGTRRQVLCVTHLPQVASFADHHFRVEKREGRGGVESLVASLDREKRIAELARMLAGEETTAKSRAHARELYDAHRRHR
ncbi:MAG TPA: DNA repair protein RecN [Casimicrobiaceae bacterium]|nr:DNA repair protein RecN [Casimicrobiaceae bacterium]